MYSRVATATIRGIQSVPVCVEADVSDGMPVFEMVGFLASEVKEARERVRTALRNVGCALPPRRITVNFMPADIRKSGAGFDLPIAVAVLAAMGRLPHAVLDDVLIVGEIGLNGVVQPVHGVLPMVAEAKERGIRRCIVPRANRKEAALVSGMLVCGVENIGEVMRLLEDASWEKYAAEEYNIEETQPAVLPDFSEIHGQRLMKRACEVAVTGMHNLLFVGPPGAGKTMVASRIHSAAACGGGAHGVIQNLQCKRNACRGERSAYAAPVPGAASHRECAGAYGRRKNPAAGGDLTGT